ncbi:hypothetical protein FSW04_21255 [Baekduia soli]|uniref:Uncharacterized protein n=1 Tax=Baekduia soli TaxID=496014 RepID=A0A5B8UA49_9ACTN|nr:hypothetical protein [Baekduia soli]QEC49844.1 hypothetical protein FSW04_21255 [Baekduia soli]
MRPLTSLPTALAVAAALAVPAAAGAATDFTGVTATGDVATFTNQSAGGLMTLAHGAGLTAGARVVGLDTAPGGRLLALDTTGRISQLDTGTGRFTALFGGTPVLPGVPDGGAVTFSVAADGATALVVAGGNASQVDLATGAAAATTVPGYAAGDASAGRTPALAVDRLPDGRLIGLDGTAGDAVLQSDAGLGSLPAARVPQGGQTTATVAPDGSAWGVRRILLKGSTANQSFLVRLDPSRGAVPTGYFFQRPFQAIAATGTSPDVTGKPKATIKVAARQSLRDIRRHGGLRVSVTSAVPGQKIASARVGGRSAGFGSDLGELPATRAKVITLDASTAQLCRIKVGSHVRVHVSVHGLARPMSSTIVTSDRVVTITR